MPGQQEVEASVESVVVVDDHNFVLGSVPREKMREEALCHRATYIFCLQFNGAAVCAGKDPE